MRRLAGIAGPRWESSLTAEPALFNAFRLAETLEMPMEDPLRPRWPPPRQCHPRPAKEAISCPKLGQIGPLPGRYSGLLKQGLDGLMGSSGVRLQTLTARQGTLANPVRPRSEGKGLAPRLRLPHLEHPPGKGPATRGQGPPFRVRRRKLGDQPKRTTPPAERAGPEFEQGQRILPGLQLSTKGEQLSPARHQHTLVPEPADQHIASFLETRGQFRQGQGARRLSLPPRKTGLGLG
jgi:hypothetical protein